MALCFNVGPRKNIKCTKTGQLSLPVHVRGFVLLDSSGKKCIKPITCFRDIVTVSNVKFYGRYSNEE